MMRISAYLWKVNPDSCWGIEIREFVVEFLLSTRNVWLRVGGIREIAAVLCNSKIEYVLLVKHSILFSKKVWNLFWSKKPNFSFSLFWIIHTILFQMIYEYMFLKVYNFIRYTYGFFLNLKELWFCAAKYSQKSKNKNRNRYTSKEMNRNYTTKQFCIFFSHRINYENYFWL